jgi:hypothetical protein
MPLDEVITRLPVPSVETATKVLLAKVTALHELADAGVLDVQVIPSYEVSTVFVPTATKVLLP